MSTVRERSGSTCWVEKVVVREVADLERVDHEAGRREGHRGGLGRVARRARRHLHRARAVQRLEEDRRGRAARAGVDGRVIWQLPGRSRSWPGALGGVGARHGDLDAAGRAPAPAGSPSLHLESWPMVWGAEVDGGRAHGGRDRPGVGRRRELKPVGVTTCDQRDASRRHRVEHRTCLERVAPLNMTGLSTIVPTLEPPVG